MQSLVEDLQAAGRELGAFVDRQLDALSAMQCQLERRERSLDSLESERAALARDLESARKQLRQQAESSRRERAEERRMWLGEIKRLRHALERAAMAGQACDESSGFHEADDVGLDEIFARLERLQSELDEPFSEQHLTPAAADEMCFLEFQPASADGREEEAIRHE